MISALAVRAYHRGEFVPTDVLPATVGPEPGHYLTLVVDNPDAATTPKAAELVNRAALCLGENQHAMAFGLAQEAVSLAPDNPGAWVALGAALAGDRQWDEAIAAYEKAATLKSERPETMALAHLLRGYAHAARGEFGAAVAAYEQALSIAPDDADIYLNLGLAHGRLGHLRDALATYERGLAVAPRDLEMHVVRGIMLASLGRRGEAGRAFRRGAALAAAGTAAARMPVSTAIVYDLAGRREDGLREYRRLADREPANADVNFLCAVVLLEAERPDDALLYFERAIARDPTNADAHFFYGAAFDMLRQPRGAADAYDRAVALDPNHAEAYFRRGFALARIPRGDDAIASLDTALHGLAKEAVRPSRALNDHDRELAYRYLAEALSYRTRHTEDLQVLSATIGILDRLIAACPISELRQTAASEKKYVSLKILSLLILDLLLPAMPDEKQRTESILKFLELIEVPEAEMPLALEAAIREVTARRMPRPKQRRRPTWEKRSARDRDLSPPEFIRRHYGDLIETGTLSLADLASYDPSLYQAVRNWKSYRQRKGQSTEIGFDLPTRRDVTDRLIDRVVASGVIRPEDAIRITSGLNWRRRKGPKA